MRQVTRAFRYRGRNQRRKARVIKSGKLGLVPRNPIASNNACALIRLELRLRLVFR